ncbi:adenosylcobinamide-GDP ribazoletransferase [Aureimonas phyllosphaerae]|uniref:Adenosylcobinamide-GDP ribazoletransferase n=1 Tax=Aureimonas phyllosphaerae TaxID=1166078 RepID=A0A7W6BV57_9HYPH|nr:adenosylcobinamide-GDP ribazoletransferase [Aureimonas phyllosphaerae]MBB3936654.1 adenosylcobinamide-GDP ribazoletransferase [Aureimonas phyllosphaerae]MBB3960482.1 adenosylcobinamide-GDP ribazoletransferase [Aureimonas phyllosphaerae]SFF23597.1 cobalamin-5'-phosphate synthase [Aureimonas phyllosphaerae]
MIRLVHSVLRACAFLTRLPTVPAAFAGAPVALGRDAPAFPVAGILAAALPALVLLGLLAAGLAPLAAATAAVLLLVVLTGALHEDGLGDTADGIFGHADRDRALAIMKDSRIGTYGALALMGSLALRISLLAAIAELSGPHAALALLAAAAGSRGAMALLWSALPSADPGGLADRVGRPSGRRGAAAALVGLALSAALTLPVFGWSALALPPALAALGWFWLRGVLLRRLGGQTGDTLGACQQIGEIAWLLGLALISR